ncbi:ABC transporter permease [Anaerotignum lactatifermentans]|uniref:ABC transporter permease n=1 Tax=Anaerotignum lactatifermentans TaxID=160404 RepID=A0ABS2G8K3_9FIRM|nr:ABC transporter permease [Anaerotignum lactatifermentans]MBM6829448.1 ABC transporter permease [Anaerotignum lactatifermentans]MBM6877806.1 ABC transporter permease [Anaerotignum lactatifermentans]MBM6951025.1 ABC transporter permease [Anaerotignum lactatifermentans]
MMNPVLRREAVTTMRNWKTYGALLIFLAITSVGAAFYVYASMFQNYLYNTDPAAMVWLYVVLAGVQMGLVMLATPAIAAGSISGERERQTLDLLLVTKMTPLSIVWGKMMSSLIYVLLLVVATVPVFGVAFYYGSISLGSILLMLLFILVMSLALSAVSVFLSCIFRKTVISIVLMYLIIGVLCFGTLILLAFYALFAGRSGQIDMSLWISVLILLPNPGAAFFSLMDMQMGSGIVHGLLNMAYYHDGNLVYWLAEHLWMAHMAASLAVTALFVWLSARMIDPVREKRRRKS